MAKKKDGPKGHQPPKAPVIADRKKLHSMTRKTEPGVVGINSAKILNEVASMYAEGVPQSVIAERMGMDLRTVATKLDDVRRMWVEASVLSMDDARVSEMARIDHLERLAYEAWHRSLTGVGQRTKQRTYYPTRAKSKEGEKAAPVLPPGKMSLGSMTVTDRTSEVGDSRFLDRIAWCIEMRAKLRGLLKTEVNQTNVVQVLDWSSLMREASAPRSDPLQEKLRELGQHMGEK